MIRPLSSAVAGLVLGTAATVGAFAYGTGVTTPAPVTRPVIVQCVETVDSHGDASLNRCDTGTVNHAAMACARAAFLADDYAHTHTGARHERRAVRRCSAMVGGF